MFYLWAYHMGSHPYRSANGRGAAFIIEGTAAIDRGRCQIGVR